MFETQYANLPNYKTMSGLTNYDTAKIIIKKPHFSHEPSNKAFHPNKCLDY